MRKGYLVPALTAAFIAASPGIATGIKSTYGAIFNPKGGIEEVVQAPKRNLEGLLGGVAYGQEKVHTGIDYQKLADEAEKMNVEKNPDKVIALVGPYINDVDNNSSSLFNNLGVAYYTKYRQSDTGSLLEKAIELFEKAIELKPSNAIAHYNLGIAYNRKGENAKAIKEFKTVLDYDNNYKNAKIWLKSLER